MNAGITSAGCATCSGSGFRYGDRCSVCVGTGAVAIVAPRTSCGTCAGSGFRYGDRCTACEGCGWANRVDLAHAGIGVPAVVSPASSVVDTTTQDAMLSVLKEIRQASRQTSQQVAEMGSIAYVVGMALSFGSNLAMDKGFIASALLSLLSWINVGYAVVGLTKPG